MSKTRGEIEEEISKLRGGEMFSYRCEYCGVHVERKVNNILRSLRKNKTKGLFCSQSCGDKSVHGEYSSSYSCTNCSTVFKRRIAEVPPDKNVFCGRACSASFNTKGRAVSDIAKKKIKESLNLRFAGLSESLPKEYNKVCRNCGCDFRTAFKTYKFCSMDCSTEAVINKQKLVKKRHAPRQETEQPSVFCKIIFSNCAECTVAFSSRNKGKPLKFCSAVCRAKSASRFMSDRLSKSENRVNLGRGKPSWMEKSFADWLDEFGIEYRTEVQFKNHTLNKYYYADFVFDKESLIIELDGNHHRFTKEKDAIRDDYLKNYYGYDVLRVTHKEYRSKAKLPVIKDLLGIPQ